MKQSVKTTEMTNEETDTEREKLAENLAFLVVQALRRHQPKTDEPSREAIQKKS